MDDITSLNISPQLPGKALSPIALTAELLDYVDKPCQ